MQGRTYPEIADELGISASGVGRALGRVCGKLGVKGRENLKTALGAPLATVSGVLFFPKLEKSSEQAHTERGNSNTPRTELQNVLHLLNKATQTGVPGVDKTTELNRLIEFFRGILPTTYALTYQLRVSEAGQVEAEVKIREV
mgnify:FL=1